MVRFWFNRLKIIKTFFYLLQLRVELGRILDEEGIVISMKNQFNSYWRPKLLAFIKASKNKEVARIMELLDDVEYAHEQGNDQPTHLYYLSLWDLMTN